MEDYVNFETAKLLKKAGFDWGCTTVFMKRFENRDKVDFEVYYPGKDFNHVDGIWSHRQWSAPTLAMAAKWLREKHHINIAVIAQYDCGGKLYGYEVWLQGTSKGREIQHHSNVKYESAFSAGIKKALDLITDKTEESCE